MGPGAPTGRTGPGARPIEATAHKGQLLVHACWWVTRGRAKTARARAHAISAQSSEPAGAGAGAGRYTYCACARARYAYVIACMHALQLPGLGKIFWGLTKTKAVGPTMPIQTHATKKPGSLDTKTAAPRRLTIVRPFALTNKLFQMSKNLRGGCAPPAPPRVNYRSNFFLSPSPSSFLLSFSLFFFFFAERARRRGCTVAVTSGIT